jgi:shikimate dehydrogenase
MNIQKVIDHQSKQHLFVSMSTQPRRVGIQFYTKLFEHYSIDAEYHPCLTTDLEYDLTLARESCSGISISMPYKNVVRQFLDEQVDIGPVNTIKIVDKKLIGHNCDLKGIEDLLENHIEGRTVNLLGDGAMADNFKILCKDKATLNQFSRKLDNWNDRYSNCDILVNATSVGMIFNETPISIVKNAELVIDCVIGNTELIETASRESIDFITGRDLYLNQLYHQFKVYTGIAPDKQLLYNISKDIL